MTTYLTPSKLPAEDEHSPPSTPGPLTPRRQSDESSTTRSDYGDAENPPPTVPPAVSEFSSPPTRTLDVWHTSAHTNLLVTEGPAQTPLYYLTNWWTPGHPEVTLHAGSSKAAPVVACARFRTPFAKTIKVGLGDPDGPACAWESLTRVKMGVNHRWDFEVGVSGEAARRVLVWEHTRSKDTAPEAQKWSMQNLRLVDKSGGGAVVLAVFTNNGVKSWKKKGKLTMYGTLGDDAEAWERLVLASGFGLVDKLRRLARVARGYGS